MTSSAVSDARSFDVPVSDDRTLRAFESGDPDGIAVVFHHGTPGSGLQSRRWTADATAKGIRLVSYDRAGYGGSTRHAGRLVADVAADVAAAADHWVWTDSIPGVSLAEDRIPWPAQPCCPSV